MPKIDKMRRKIVDEKVDDIVGTILDRTIELPDGRILAYKIYGEPTGIPFLFIHGFGSSAAAIDPDLAWLKKNNTYILAYQRPGYGYSQLKKQYKMSDVADDIKYLIDVLAINQVALIGWSAGGLYCQVFAHLYPEHVMSMTLVSSAIPFNSKLSKNILPSNWKMIYIMNRYFPFFSKRFFKRLSYKIEHQFDHTIDQSIRELVDADRIIANQPTIKNKITIGAQEAYQYEGLAVYYDALAMTERIDLIAKSKPFNVYIWQGDQDRTWTLKTSEYLKSQYEKSHMYVVKGQGHLLYLSHWEEIVSKALRF